MSGLDWLWWGIATWLAVDLAATAWWAWYRNRQKRAAITRRLEALKAREEQVKRDVADAKATRQRLLAEARTFIPHQRRQEDQPWPPSL